MLRGRRPSAPVDFLLIGLGNPGSRYVGTRHNVGFEVANVLATRWELPRARKMFGGLVTEGRIGPGMPRVAVLLPQTYMNESGRAAGPARGQYGLDLDQIVAIHDEIDLPFGEVRERKGGGLAGHNGLKSIKAHLHTDDFVRVRIGVGKPPGSQAGRDYVLRRPGKAEQTELDVIVERAADAVETVLTDGVDSAMARFNAIPDS